MNSVWRIFSNRISFSSFSSFSSVRISLLLQLYYSTPFHKMVIKSSMFRQHNRYFNTVDSKDYCIQFYTNRLVCCHILPLSQPCRIIWQFFSSEPSLQLDFNLRSAEQNNFPPKIPKNIPIRFFMSAMCHQFYRFYSTSYPMNVNP